ncbi:MAG TPA: histone deacetylase, partial [Oligoflexia bacterium]|nr:histone deacetylase [Oligoflexia bacterium]
ACAEGEPYIDTPDSSICKESFEIALYAAGSAMRCVDLVMAGEIENAFALVRPPGHHAEAGCSMGFCLLNNIALCAQRLLARWGLTRVLIVDFDVHHGNGTQHLFEADPRVLFFSMHGHPNSFYPGTGYEHERGLEAGSGTTINCPMLPGFGDDEYRRAFYEVLIPAAESFQPEFVLVSAGFDAHQDDWISRIALDDSSYEWLSRGIVSLAQRWARGRVVSLLEGGYNLDALCRCAAIHLRELLAAQSAA